MAENKTQPTSDDVDAFLAAVDHPKRREDAIALNALFKEVTGFAPVMWGTIIGYGAYDYTYESGRSGRFLATGFSPRKANLSVYVMPGYQQYGAILDQLGPHKMGKSCLYITRLDAVDVDVLKTLIETGLKDLNDIWAVQPS